MIDHVKLWPTWADDVVNVWRRQKLGVEIGKKKTLNWKMCPPPLSQGMINHGKLWPTWANMGPSWAQLGAILGPSWALLGPSLGLLGPISGHVGAVFGHLSITENKSLMCS